MSIARRLDHVFRGYDFLGDSLKPSDGSLVVTQQTSEQSRQNAKSNFIREMRVAEEFRAKTPVCHS